MSDHSIETADDPIVARLRSALAAVGEATLVAVRPGLPPTVEASAGAYVVAAQPGSDLPPEPIGGLEPRGRPTLQPLRRRRASSGRLTPVTRRSGQEPNPRPTPVPGRSRAESPASSSEPVMPSVGHRRPLRWGIAAALIAATVAVGVVAARRAPSTPVGSGGVRTSDFRHPLLGSPMPDGFGLVRITDDELLYISGSGEIHLSVGPGRVVDPDTVVRGDRAAEWSSPSDRSRVLRWEEHPGLLVEIDARWLDGAGAAFDDTAIVALADAVVMVTDKAWSVVVDSMGFDEFGDSSNDRVTFGWLPSADEGPFGRRLSGSAQSGVSVMLGCCFGPGPISSYVGRWIAVDGQQTWIIIARYPAVTFEVVLSDGTTQPRRPLAIDPGRPNLRTASAVAEKPGSIDVRFYDEAGTLITGEQG